MTFYKAFDLSSGQSLRPFLAAARWATRQSLNTIHAYDDDRAATKDALWGVGTFLKRELNIIPPDRSGVPLNRIVPTTGITEAFEMTLRVLSDNVANYAKRTGETLQPALIMPAPTYGMFRDTAECLGYKIITIQREKDKNWHLDPAQLVAALKDIRRSENLHPTAFFDSNPHNPTGIVRGRKETIALAQIFHSFNKSFKQQRRGPKKRWHRWVPDLYVIDDMAYLGTEYGSVKPLSFSAIPELHHHTFLMLGLSKIGLAGLRAGLVIVPNPPHSSFYLCEIQKMEFSRRFFLASPSLQALKFCFSDNARHITTRQNFITDLARDHAFCGLLMKALINGIEDVAVSDFDREKMIRIVADVRNTNRQDAIDILKLGVLGARVTTTPEAGFFHLIDFSALRGSTYQNALTDSDIIKINDEFAIHKVFSKWGLGFASGERIGFDREDMVVRVSYAFLPEEIVRICHRLEMVCRQFVRGQTAHIGLTDFCSSEPIRADAVVGPVGFEPTTTPL